ncbi:MAG: hypothetical protein R3D63_03140 [Paracoccaceae bacterium]
MPYIVALLGLLAGAWFWMNRVKAAGNAAQDLVGMAQDVVSAARRFGFRRRYNEHPVDSLTDPDVAIAGAGLAFLELSGLPSAEQQDALLVSLQSHLGHERGKAEEAMILGRWLVTESGGAGPALTRLCRRLQKMKGPEALPPLMSVLNDVAAAGRDTALSPRQREALDEISRAFRLG